MKDREAVQICRDFKYSIDPGGPKEAKVFMEYNDDDSDYSYPKMDIYVEFSDSELNPPQGVWDTGHSVSLSIKDLTADFVRDSAVQYGQEIFDWVVNLKSSDKDAVAFWKSEVSKQVEEIRLLNEYRKHNNERIIELETDYIRKLESQITHMQETIEQGQFKAQVLARYLGRP